jgi:hypothetical protein
MLSSSALQLPLVFLAVLGFVASCVAHMDARWLWPH